MEEQFGVFELRQDERPKVLERPSVRHYVHANVAVVLVRIYASQVVLGLGDAKEAWRFVGDIVGLKPLDATKRDEKIKVVDEGVNSAVVVALLLG
jgi:hypothetical protein